MKIKSLKFAVLAVAISCCANAFSADYFDALFSTVKVTGKVWILRPGDKEPIPAKDEFRYPYGSKVIVEAFDKTLPEEVVQKNEVMLVFGSDYQIKLGMGTNVSTKKTVTETGDAKVNVFIEKGVVSTFITVPPPSSKMGDKVEDAKLDARLNAFVIDTPLASTSALVERNEIRVTTDADGLVKSKYKIESGFVNLDGNQFSVLKTRRQTEFNIVGDQEFTRLDIENGNATVRINRGDVSPYQNVFKQNSSIKFWKVYTKIQKKMAVAVMLTMPNGKIERFEYIENPSDILNSLEGKGKVIESTEDVDVAGEENTEDSWDEDFSEDATSEENAEETTEEAESSSDDFFSDSGDDDFFSSDDWDF